MLFAQDFNRLVTSSAQMATMVSKFTEETPDFTAVLQFQALDAKGMPKMQMMMDMLMTKTKMRNDILVQAMPQIPEDQRAAMKSLRVDRIAYITHLEAKKMYVTFPDIAVFQEFPLADAALEEIAARSKSVTLQKTEIGPENVNGHACVKTLVEVTETNRPPEKAVIWYASDLRRFPLRIVIRKDNLLHVFEFKGVKLVSPNPALFQIPTNYTRVEDTAQVLRIAHERIKAKGEPFPMSSQGSQSPHSQ